jgi:CheY-like chemotaxis protein
MVEGGAVAERIQGGLVPNIPRASWIPSAIGPAFETAFFKERGMSEEPLTSSASSSSPPRPFARAVRTLFALVDDDSPTALHLRSGLALLCVARDADEAVARVRQDGSFQAVVIDLDLPGGVAAVDEILELRPSLPILAVGSDEFAAGEALLAGAAWFLPKPCTTDELAAALAAIL